MKTEDLLKDLQLWYEAQCDGEWERGYGIKIETLGNPGWSLIIELADTLLEGKPFKDVKYGCDDDEESSVDWLWCCVKDNKFDGAGGPGELEEIIKIFIGWAKTEKDWLALPPGLTQEEMDRGWYDELGEDVGPEKCRHDGCDSLKIEFSVFCRKHHFRQIKGYLPGW